jgi:hypothetical protein
MGVAKGAEQAEGAEHGEEVSSRAYRRGRGGMGPYYIRVL